MRDQVDFDLEVIDIGGSPELERRYRELLPVVEIDGEQAFTYFVDSGGAALAPRSLTRRFPRRPREGRWQNRDALSQTIDRGTT